VGRCEERGSRNEKQVNCFSSGSEQSEEIADVSHGRTGDRVVFPCRRAANMVSAENRGFSGSFAERDDALPQLDLVIMYIIFFFLFSCSIFLSV
jgi:hypothetical protein